MITTSLLPWNITLERHSIGHPDEVGSVPFWQTELDQLIRQNPFPQFWSSLKLEVWHMNDPQLKHDQPNVLDYNLGQIGNQSAYGLCFMGGKKRIQIAVYPDNWKADQSGPNIANDISRARSRQALSHEIGHMYADQCGIFTNYDRISAELTALFRKYRTFQTASEVEDIAEIYRACMGGDEVRGKYSDGKIAAISAELSTLMKAMFWLSTNLRHQNINDVTVSPDFVQWATPGILWLKSHYRLNLQKWQLERWTGSAWVKS